MKKIKSSIQYKFIICFILSFLLFANISIYLWYYNSTKHAKNTSAAYMKQIMSITNSNLEVALKDIQSILYTLSISDLNSTKLCNILQKDNYSSDSEQYHDETIMQEFLSRMSYNKYYLNGLTVFNQNGTFFQNGVTMPFQEMKTQDWFSKILENQQACVFIEPHYYNTSLHTTSTDSYKNMVFSYAKSIVTNNTIIGYMVADVKCDILMDVFGQPEMLDKMSIILVDTKYQEPIFSPLNNHSHIFSEVQIKELMEDANTSEDYFYKTLDGEQYLAVALKSNFTGWTTLGLIPLSSTLYEFYSTRTLLVIFSVILAACSILLLWLLSFLLTKNLKLLTAAVSDISKDHLEFNLEIRTDDEIGILSIHIHAMVQRIKELVEETKKKERDKRKAEMKFLQAQINPHFLHNTLNSIKFIASIHNLDNIVSITESLSTLMHTNMSNESFISLESEAKYLESYINILSYKYSTLSYSIQLDENVKKHMILKMLIQPIVENAIMHSVLSPSQHIILNIKIYEEEGILIIQVTDNGNGLTEQQIEAILSGNFISKGNGIAISNIISRIHLYFGENYGLEINSHPGIFTTVLLKLPLIMESEVPNYV